MSQTDMDMDTITIQLTDVVGSVLWSIYNDETDRPKASGQVKSQGFEIDLHTGACGDMNAALASALVWASAHYTEETIVNVVANDDDLYCQTIVSLRGDA